jgi:hypothetical protein
MRERIIKKSRGALTGARLCEMDPCGRTLLRINIPRTIKNKISFTVVIP